MLPDQSYKTKSFNLHGLEGISDKTIDMHLSLYEGYVKATNALQGRIAEFLKDGQVDQEEFPAYSELTRRVGFEFNGMVLHEYYFENLTPKASVKPETTSAFLRRAEASFGTYDRWKTDFISVGKIRGVGWAICFQDPATGRLRQPLGDSTRARQCRRVSAGPRHGCLGACVPTRLFSR